MQNLKKLITSKSKKGLTENDLLNLIREYIQIQILKFIYDSKYGKGLSFGGGTCLRICYDLKRFSEDLDFCLDRKIVGYSFKKLNEMIISNLEKNGFKASLTLNDKKIVQKSFIRISEILHFFGVSPMKARKLHVKLEIDTNPIKVTNKDLETFFVNKYNEIFPILKHNSETMFASKILAVLNRSYTKGRDFYDLIWYLGNKTEINFSYLNKELKKLGSKQVKNKEEVVAMLKKRISKVKSEEILKDIERFLEDVSEIEWIKDYHRLFEQLTTRGMQ